MPVTGLMAGINTTEMTNHTESRNTSSEESNFRTTTLSSLGTMESTLIERFDSTNWTELNGTNNNRSSSTSFEQDDNHTNNVSTTSWGLMENISKERSNLSRKTNVNGTIPSRARRPLLTPISNMADKIFKIMNPFMYGLGIPANIISIIIFNLSENRKSTVSIYLSALALGDIGVLLCSMVNYLEKNVVKGPLLKSLSSASCGLYFTVLQASYLFGTWMLIAVSIDRYIAICHPLKSKLWLRVRYARIYVCITAVVMLCVSMVNLNSFTAYPPNYCIPKIPDAYMALYIIIPFYTIIPLLLLIAFNSLIISWFVSKTRKDSINSKIEKQIGTRRRQLIQLTTMVVIMTISYLILTTPSAILQAVNFWEKWEVTDVTTFIPKLVSQMVLINHFINFFLYIISGKKFRQEASRIFCQSWCLSRSIQKETNGNQRNITRRNPQTTYISSCQGYRDAPTQIQQDLDKF